MTCCKAPRERYDWWEQRPLAHRDDLTLARPVCGTDVRSRGGRGGGAAAVPTSQATRLQRSTTTTLAARGAGGKAVRISQRQQVLQAPQSMLVRCRDHQAQRPNARGRAHRGQDAHANDASSPLMGASHAAAGHLCVMVSPVRRIRRHGLGTGNVHAQRHGGVVASRARGRPGAGPARVPRTSSRGRSGTGTWHVPAAS